MNDYSMIHCIIAEIYCVGGDYNDPVNHPKEGAAKSARSK